MAQKVNINHIWPKFWHTHLQLFVQESCSFDIILPFDWLTVVSRWTEGLNFRPLSLKLRSIRSTPPQGHGMVVNMLCFTLFYCNCNWFLTIIVWNMAETNKKHMCILVINVPVVNFWENDFGQGFLPSWACYYHGLLFLEWVTACYCNGTRLETVRGPTKKPTCGCTVTVTCLGMRRNTGPNVPHI